MTKLTPASTVSHADTRTAAGSNYGDAVPQATQHDPSKGAELERDALPADADFSVPPTPSASDAERAAAAGDASAREERVRRAAYQRYQQRVRGDGQGGGDAASDWREAEAAIDNDPTRG